MTCPKASANVIVVRQDIHTAAPHCRRLSVPIAVLVVVFSLTGRGWSQAQKPSQPDPVKFLNKYEVCYNVVRAVLVEMGHSIELEDRKGGRIVAKPYDFIAGSLTSSEVGKVALKNDTITGDWVRARYTAEGLLEIVSPTQTMVTIRIKFEALNREIDGAEKWIPLESLGVIEKRILGKVSMKLLGNELEFDNKKGFWEKTPSSPDIGRPKPYPQQP